MFSFLSEFTRDLGSTYTVLVMDEDGLEQPRQHRVRPLSLMLVWSFATLVMTSLAVSLLVFTPMRELIPGYGTEEIRHNARLNALRLAALQDSIYTQQQYITQLRLLMLGQVDTSATLSAPDAAFSTVSGDLNAVTTPPTSPDWSDHQQPALPVSQMRLADGEPPIVVAGTQFLSSLQFPVRPPVSGFLTRGFDARIGHYAIDLAIEEGTVVRAIGDGYVIFEDWTHGGGHTIAIQHANGFVSLYKHNQRLLKRTGDRVRDREAIALSGNSGEITTGPHLHFELWHDGLAQDPQLYLVEG